MENNKFFIYALIVFVLLGGIINSVIGINSYLKDSEISKNGTKIKAMIKNEIQNNFGEYPSYKYAIEYNYNGKKYSEINDGVFKAGRYKIGQEIEILVDNKNPQRFTDVSNVHFKNNFIISFFCILFFGLLMFYKKNIIKFMDKLS